MHPLSPVIGIAILSAVLTTHCLRTAWRTGILHALGRRQALNWRTLVAGAVAGLTPIAGAVLAWALVPSNDSADASYTAGMLAMQLAAFGFWMHGLSEVLIRWGRPARYHRG